MLQGPEGGGLTVAVMLVVPVYAVNIDGVLGDGGLRTSSGLRRDRGEVGGTHRQSRRMMYSMVSLCLLFYLYCRQYVSHTQYKLIRRQSYDYRHMKK